MNDEKLIIDGQEFNSRLILGTGGLPSLDILSEIIETTSAEIATLAVRRVDPNQKVSIFKILNERSIKILPNTAGCYTASEAVKLSEMARESLETDWIKLEVIADEKSLLPDSTEMLRACEILIDKGFKVLAYTNADLVIARKLAALGASAIMPLAAPIGSGMGLENINGLIRIIQEIDYIPIIIDAGIGTASDAAIAMEIGADAVLVASAITRAVDSVKMAKAIRLGVEAGFLASRAGRIPRQLYAVSSSTKDNIPNLT